MATAVRQQVEIPPRRKHGRDWHKRLGALAQIADPCMVGLGLWLAAWVRGQAFTLRYETLGAMACLSCIVLFHVMGIYRARWHLGGLNDVSSVTLAWGGTATTLFILGYLTKTTADFSRLVISIWLLLVLLLLVVFDYLVRALLGRLRSSGADLQRVVIAPYSPQTARLAAEFDQDPRLGVELLGFFHDGPLPMPAIRYLGDLSELPNFVREQDVDAIYLAAEPEKYALLWQLLEPLQASPTAIYLLPSLFAFDMLHAEFQLLNGIPLLQVGNSRLDVLGGMAKRCFDLVLASVGLVLVSPLLLAISLLVKIDSHGPVLFRQRRYGLQNQEFRVFKFRTMYVQEDGKSMRQATRRDPRITRIGAWLRRTSLDELPQLLNVVGGSMSLVGPRPHASVMNEYYRDKIRGYMLRHTMRPGITGWAQIHGWRGETETVEKMQHRIDYDLDYMHRWSLLFDLYILLCTIPSILRVRNAY